MGIQETKEWLKSQITVVPLTSNIKHRQHVKTFSGGSKGKSMESYIKEAAWESDLNGDTKIYLVKYKETEEIIFFFGLHAGLLYRNIEHNKYSLTEIEQDIIDLCINYKLEPNNTITPDEVFSWYADEPLDKERLIRIIESETKLKLAAKEDQEHTGEITSFHVSQTFPGIVLSHFSKNANFSLPIEISFPLGFYIFWEIIVEKVLEISSMLGCRYLYLFAADNTDCNESADSYMNLLLSDFNECDETSTPIYKLVDYYKNELKFEEVQDMTILKPHYDYNCFSLIQSISALQENRKTVWIQHSDTSF